MTTKNFDRIAGILPQQLADGGVDSVSRPQIAERRRQLTRDDTAVGEVDGTRNARLGRLVTRGRWHSRLVGIDENHGDHEVHAERGAPGREACGKPPVAHRSMWRGLPACVLVGNFLQRAIAPATKVAVRHVGVSDVFGDEAPAPAADGARGDGRVDVFCGRTRPFRVGRQASVRVEFEHRDDRGARRDSPRANTGDPELEGRRAGDDRAQQDDGQHYIAGVRSSAHTEGVSLIIAYKWSKAVLQLAVAAILFHAAHRGLAASLDALAAGLRAHAVHVWSDAAAGALMHLVGRPHALLLVAAALAGDAAISAVEGWVLFRGYSWGPWLVVGATGSMLPFEIIALARHAHVGRAVLLAINVAVVVTLIRRARRTLAAT